MSTAAEIETQEARRAELVAAIQRTDATADRAAANVAEAERGLLLAKDGLRRAVGNCSAARAELRAFDATRAA